MSVNPLIVMLVTGAVLPLVNGLVFKYASNPNLLRLANAVLAFVANGIAYALADDGSSYVFDNRWWSFITASFVSLVIAQAAYLNIFVPVKLTDRPDGILPDGGIKLGTRLPEQYPAGVRPAA